MNKTKWIIEGSVNYGEYDYPIEIIAEIVIRIDDYSFEVDGTLITLPKKIESIRHESLNPIAEKEWIPLSDYRY